MSMTELRAHTATIVLKEAPPADVPVGTTFVVEVAVARTEACDLEGTVLMVAAPDGAGPTQQSPSAETKSHHERGVEGRVRRPILSTEDGADGTVEFEATVVPVGGSGRGQAVVTADK